MHDSLAPRETHNSRITLTKRRKTVVMKLPNSIHSLADLTTLIINGVTILGTLAAALAGTSATVAGLSGMPQISLHDVALPWRLVAFGLLAAALGWGLGAIVRHYSQSRREGLRLLCPIAGLCWGGLLVGTAQWATAGAATEFPELVFFTLVGLGLVFRLAVFQFRSEISPATGTTIRLRSDALLFFAASATVLLILTDVAGGQ